MNQVTSVAEERKNGVEAALVSILRKTGSQTGLDIDEILVNLKKKIDPSLEMNREVVRVHLGGLISAGKIIEGDGDDKGKFFWDHYRGLCHVIVDGYCKCCGENIGFIKQCPSCHAR